MKKKGVVANTAEDPVKDFAEFKGPDGQTYKLVYDFNAIAKAQSATFVNLLDGLQNLQQLNAAQFRGLFHAALLVHHPEMKAEAAGKLLTLSRHQAAFDALVQAYNLSFTREKEQANPTGAAPAAAS